MQYMDSLGLDDDEKEGDDIAIADLSPLPHVIMMQWMQRMYETSFTRLYEMVTYLRRTVVRAVLRNSVVSGLRVRMHFLIQQYLHYEDDAAGVAHGKWRTAMKVFSKETALHDLRVRLVHELRKARTEFVADHQLTITVFDSTMDTSGLFTLICQYDWHRLRFTFMLWIELTMVVLLAAPANYFLTWQMRMEVLGAVNVLFIMLTYLLCPYTELADRWIDFIGRVVVLIVCVGLLFCDTLIPPSSVSVSSSSTARYAPWHSFSYVSHVNPATAGLYLLTDLIMVLAVYLYVLGTLHRVGVFAVLHRYFNSLMFIINDHIFDFLIAKLDERTIGT